MTARVLVAGSGVAGAAAALAAASAGASVTLIDGGTGASALAPGALDALPWDAPDAFAADDAPLDEPHARAALDALGAYDVPDAGVLLATLAGALRPARGRDRALLDLGAVGGGLVVVPRADHPSWDAGALARSWNDTRAARERGLEFVAVDATLTRMVDERALPDADVAARHDDPARLAWLAARVTDALARASGRACAVALPPWLGAEHARADELTRAVGLPCGEAMAGPGRPAGLRFERARDRALSLARVAVVAARVTEVARDEARWRVTLDAGEPLGADGVVLAVGGLVGGGLAYTPSGAMLAGELPPRARASFAATLDAPIALGLGGRPLALPGSIFGEPPESLALLAGPSDVPPMERVGALASRAGHVENGLYVAGDFAADRPRTWLAALAQGARAGRAAATRVPP